MMECGGNQFQLQSEEEEHHVSSSGKVRWMLEKGVSVGKKVLVTGFVLSSAPVVLPPLLVISAIGFACSLPYGFLLATYACTHSLMTKLLPLPPPPSPLFLEYDTSKDHDDVADDYDDSDDEGLRGDFYEGEDDKMQNGFEKELVELVEGKDEIVEENRYEEDVDEYMEGGRDETTMDIEMKIEGIGEERGESVDEVSAVLIEMEGDESGIIRGGGGGGESQFEVTNVVVEMVYGGNVDENKEMVREATGVIEKIRDEGRADKDLAKEKNKPNEENVLEATIPKEMQAVENVSLHKDERETADETGFHLYHHKNSAEHVTPEGHKQSVPAAPKNADTMEITIPSKASEPKPTGNSSANEDPYSEETIWTQINAMRKIVGCTAAPRATCIDELKALYVFTGVEPPASFKDPSDLIEVSDKLRFLMSIVGVK